MELKVWVDGVQRVVCGVTEATSCHDVVIALAQAIGRTGRYTLVEKWRDSERLLAPHESPVSSLNTWGQYAGDVQLILLRTGPSLTERGPSEGPLLRGPERGPLRQSLPPLAKLRPPNERSMRRREPRRKSLTFSGGPRGLRDILSGGRPGEAEAKRRLLLGAGGGGGQPQTAGPLGALWACRVEELVRLVGLQGETLGRLEQRLASHEAELQGWGERGGHGGDRDGGGGLTEEILRLERRLRKNKVEVEEEDFWASELQIELENERQLEERLQELRRRLLGCERDVGEKMGLVGCVEAGLEEERQQRERQESQRLSEAEARAQALRARADLKAQDRQALQLESSCRAVDRSLGQSSRRLQDMQQDLEQLTKELRQVNLQQFIQQTGTKVTVLPAEPGDPPAPGSLPGPGDPPDPPAPGHSIELGALCGSLKRPLYSHPVPGRLRVLHSPLKSGLNPEGIYV
ncbi:ras association domain-containing protein 8 [Gadus morhua]|uniref:Ras association domain family member 8 n=1 Tax=Gadus morhua TaxID=8049 RepID=A0A8C5AV23_GADMO|nr:ras association domain-containing protein 8 [Gadus morhua]XP_030222034.1 ras association domain-containing protein 8 [Gadus morhua]